jgi:hypothetical protein
MSPKLERFLTRLLLVTVAASAIVMAGRYDGEAQASLYFLAAVALGGLLAPIPTSRPDVPGDGDADKNRRRNPHR